MTVHVPAGSLDTERVLGQITRGEMRCGRSAAREIAALHQEAYGNAVWGPAPTPKTDPESSVGPARPNRRNVNHAEVATSLKAQPGVWQVVGEWRSCGGAESAALRIRTAYQAPMYEPAGSFETRTALTEMGCNVEARYVGAPATSDAAWAEALADLSAGGAE